MAKQFTEEDDALLSELGVEAPVSRQASYTPREERIIAGFEEIQRFVAEHGHLPRHGEDRDVFERLYAVRLDRIRVSEECRALLEPMDSAGILSSDLDATAVSVPEGATDEELLDALGVEAETTSDLSRLKHVRSRLEIRTAEEIAQRTRCEDFSVFHPVFELVQQDLASGKRQTVKYQDNATVERGDLFILDGQKLLIEQMGELFIADHGRNDRRLRVIYDNGTESDLLMRSLQRALNKDPNSRRIVASEPAPPPLFSDHDDVDDTQSGFIYVLRSLSDHPFIVEHRKAIHKIGVTGSDVKRRIASARKDATFLLADVEVVSTYRLANVNRRHLERLLHQFFADARMDLELRDRFGGNVEPQEWFLVPLPTIQRAIELLMSGEIEHCRYETERAQIINLTSNKYL